MFTFYTSENVVAAVGATVIYVVVGVAIRQWFISLAKITRVHIRVTLLHICTQGTFGV